MSVGVDGRGAVPAALTSRRAARARESTAARSGSVRVDRRTEGGSGGPLPALAGRHATHQEVGHGRG
ncbi:hypothetical protein FHU30_004496 [Actinomadura rupiterrae]|nr:hypothetical protein [Actinomadura rupiterrae]